MEALREQYSLASGLLRDILLVMRKKKNTTRQREVIRSQAEADRKRAEKKRVRAERGRVAGEQGRVSAEDARVLAENARASLEEALRTYENLRKVEAKVFMGIAEQRKANEEMLATARDLASQATDTIRAINGIIRSFPAPPPSRLPGDERNSVM